MLLMKTKFLILFPTYTTHVRNNYIYPSRT